MAAPQAIRMTAAEYLAQERLAEFKSEFWDGEVLAMSGARRAHIRIVANLVRRLGNALGEGPCDVYSNDLRVAADPARRYFYPDVVVACEDADFLDEQLDTLLNPIVVIEVLSESTASKDRTAKLDTYRQMPSVRHYILVDSKTKFIEHHERMSDAIWQIKTLRDQVDALVLSDLHVSVTLKEIYERVPME